jgi:hypothetical protein
MTTYAIGEEGFKWFFGIVEDREDPKKLGRVRVRIYNVHPFTAGGAPDTVNVPTDHLPWATVINSIISAGILGVNKDGVGISPTGMMVGSTVFGFFADGRESQIPVILGTLAGLVGTQEDNELPKSATGVNSAAQIKESKKVNSASPFPGEPSSAFNAKYPYNKVLRTESGHLIEIDDTVSKERIHIMHKTGTYIEIDSDGQVVIKSVDDKFDITTKDNNVYVGGNVNLYVGGDVNVRVKGKVDIMTDGTFTCESKGNMLFKAPRIDFNP